MGIMKSYIGREHMLLTEKVCIECFNNEDLKDLIKSEGKTKGCDFCKSKAVSHELCEVVDHINNSLHSEYEDPAEEMGYCSEEGGYLGTTYDTDELLEIVGLDVNSPNLFETISQSIPNELWCDKDPYQLRQHEEMYFDWESFAKLVKYRCRYMFMSHETTKKYYFSGPILISKILNQLEETFVNHGLIKKLDTNTEIYRARYFDTKYPFKLELKELCPPPAGKTRSSRMSAAGIPMFYGAKTKVTAAMEIGVKSRDQIALSKFQLSDEVYVIDLVNLPPIPSIFSSRSRVERAEIIFLHKFLKDFSKKIAKDGLEHVEYVPTQVVTEFCKYRIKFNDKKIAGFKYPSAVHAGGVSYCLFADRFDCGVPKTNSLKPKKPMLTLVKNSLKFTRIK